MQTLRGTPASRGVAVGPPVILEPAAQPVPGKVGPGEVEAEIARIGSALEAAAQDLELLAARLGAEGHAAEGEIFQAQAAMARDPGLRALAEERVRTSGDDAVGALSEAARSFADQLLALRDELFVARAADVIDVGGRAARKAAGLPEPTSVQLGRPSIVVAHDLAPSVTAGLPRDRLLGIVLEAGSATAHAAILARAYAIPAVVGVAGLLEAVAARVDGSGMPTIAVDGESGEVVLEPDRASQARFHERSSQAATAHDRDLAERELPAITTDGVTVELLANIGGPAEAGNAVALGARGVGLFRTEFLFIERPRPPSEDEQLAAYQAVVEALRPHPVTVRLLDVGGDKPIPWLALPAEANPFLGVRALRLAADRPEIFITQLRAAMRAATSGPVKVMAPMVADAGDATVLADLAERARRGLEAEGVPHAPVALGVMLEIPSAILTGRTYFATLRFASLGTNDLLQYTLAVDRTNPALTRYQDSLHPALLALVRDAVVATSEAEIELSVCGEMAGDPAAALCLVGLGVRALSMVAGSLPAVRRAIRANAETTLRAAAERSLSASSAGDVRAAFAALVPAD